MAAVGIIAEYNPFHKGHAYQLAEAKRRTGCEHAIAVMSGSFVQRGEVACVSKRLRAKWALENGADLVLELPSAVSLSSSEGFARGGIRLLSGTGLVSHIAFGAETEELSLLKRCAEFEETEAFRIALARALSEGKSHPRAREEAAIFAGLPREAAEALSKPNSILAVEYLRAIARYSPELVPVPILRRGAAHDAAELSGECMSASAIRERIHENRLEEAASSLSPCVYEEISALLKRGEAAKMSNLSGILLYALRKMSIEELQSLAGVGEGLENVLFRECRNADNYEDLLARLKSKRYPMARLRRILASALLHITKEEAVCAGENLFLRVLGVRRDSLFLLSELSKHASLPVVIRAEDARALPGEALRMLRKNGFADEVFSLATKKAACKSDLAEPLIIV